MLRTFDPVIFGRRLMAARALAGIRDRRTLARQMCRMGATCSVADVRAWESGATVPRYDEVTGLLIVLAPPGGVDWFRDAVAIDDRDRLRRMDRGA